MQTRSSTKRKLESEETSEAADRGVPEEARKQLAKDIDGAGGIDNFDKAAPQALDQLLNQPGREHLYCPRGDPLRKKIRNLVREWKKWDKEKYLKQVHIPFVLGKRPLPEEPEDTPSSNPNNNNNNNNPTSPPPSISTEVPASKRARKEPPSDVNKSKPPPTSKVAPQAIKMTTSNSITNTPNKLGKPLVVPITEGRIFCALWTDVTLNAELELFFGTDRHSIWTKTKEARFSSGVEFLRTHHPGFGAKKDNVITSTVNQEIQKLDPGKGEADRWDEEEVISLNEEIIQTFVDEEGEPTEDDPVAKVIGGHQVITFFLKTKSYHEEQLRRSKCTFSKSSKGKGSPIGQTVGGNNDDDSSMGVGAAADEIRLEMHETMQQVTDSQADQQQKLQEQLIEQARRQQEREQQMQQQFLEHQKQQQEMLLQQTQEMMKSFWQMAMTGQQQQQVQQQPQQPQQPPQPQPDGHQSGGH